jgi:hypothetical protein
MRRLWGVWHAALALLVGMWGVMLTGVLLRPPPVQPWDAAGPQEGERLHPSGGHPVRAFVLPGRMWMQDFGSRWRAVDTARMEPEPLAGGHVEDMVAAAPDGNALWLLDIASSSGPGEGSGTVTRRSLRLHRGADLQWQTWSIDPSAFGAEEPPNLWDSGYAMRVVDGSVEIALAHRVEPTGDGPPDHALTVLRREGDGFRVRQREIPREEAGGTSDFVGHPVWRQGRGWTLALLRWPLFAHPEARTVTLRIEEWDLDGRQEVTWTHDASFCAEEGLTASRRHTAACLLLENAAWNGAPQETYLRLNISAIRVDRLAFGAVHGSSIHGHPLILQPTEGGWEACGPLETGRCGIQPVAVLAPVVVAHEGGWRRVPWYHEPAGWLGSGDSLDFAPPQRVGTRPEPDDVGWTFTSRGHTLLGARGEGAPRPVATRPHEVSHASLAGLAPLSEGDVLLLDHDGWVMLDETGRRVRAPGLAARARSILLRRHGAALCGRSFRSGRAMSRALVWIGLAAPLLLALGAWRPGLRRAVGWLVVVLTLVLARGVWELAFQCF